MKHSYSVKISSEQETIDFAKEFAARIIEGDVIVLNGNLGSGKTFFIKHAAGVFGINNVNSPTFSIINEYEGSKKVYHLDFYRINSAKELYDIGYDDYLNDQQAVIFIEWGNLIPEVLPEKRIEINIEVNDNFTREFFVVNYG